MTPTEMEEAIRNLQLQANRIEQFLPNLATRGELFAVRDALRFEIQDVRRQALMLNERTEDKIRILAEGVEDVRARMATYTINRSMTGDANKSIYNPPVSGPIVR